jgi:hypothetical protein
VIGARIPTRYRAALARAVGRPQRLRAARTFRSGAIAIAAEYRRVLDVRLAHLVRVDQPLVLITQMQRSGGTLLLRLLDGHPACHVVPHQLRGIDEAFKRRFAGPEQAWLALHDPKLGDRFVNGQRQKKRDVLRDEDVFPVVLPPGLQRAIYDACVDGAGRPSDRELVDCYFTSYFNAWLDNRNLRSGPKRWVVGFEPAVARSVPRRRRLRELYPDGRVIAIIRDPWTWYASARRWEPRWRDRQRAVEDWCSLAEATLAWKADADDSLRVVSFESLLSHTEETMKRLATWLEIETVPGLLEPTFNSLAIRANTSFGDIGARISAKPLSRAETDLDAEDTVYIDAHARSLYERLLARAA